MVGEAKTLSGETGSVELIGRSLLEAQVKAAALFAAVVDARLIRPGILESELSSEIHVLAKSQFGLRRHWHKRIVRAGPNTLLTYHQDCVDRRISDDDIVYLDFGPVFEEWEADFGRTYAVGADPLKHRLIADLSRIFASGKELFQRTPDLTAGQLYDHVTALATQAGWEFGASTAGHLIGQFPHERAPGDSRRFSIRRGNDLSLREPDLRGRLRHWILEVHLVDRQRQIGGFLEELLTI
jgi:Xaa-Pro dipeptidase